jgi:anti-sigma28 factor (negative regulator of flagellin synthesis)
MDKLEKIIAKLKEAREELNKTDANLNNPYGDQPKGKKGENARNDKNDKEPELESPKNLKHKDQPSIKKDDSDDHPSKLSEKDAMKLIKEEVEFSKNGQWSMKKGCMEKGSMDPKLAPKDRKVKELQTKIDSGAYKPDAGKIADAMLKPKK